MKKYILGLITIIIISIGGYFIYDNYVKETEYSIVYYELTKEDINLLIPYGKIKKIVQGELKIKGGSIKGEVKLLLKGNAQKRNEIVDKIQKNKHVYGVYKAYEEEGGELQ